jgi:hypothetical protein
MVANENFHGDMLSQNLKLKSYKKESIISFA